MGGAMETRKLMTKDEIAKEAKRQKAKQERQRDLAWSKKAGGKAISMKKKMRKEQREKNRTKIGGQEVDMKETVDMIKNPFKYNKNVKKNIQLKMKKKKRNRNYSGGRNESALKFKSSSGPVAKKFNNKEVRKKM